MRPKLHLIFVCSTTLSLFSACSPVKGYTGPDLPDNMISFVGLSYSSSDVDVSRASIKGIEFSSNGINVLPGRQQVDLSVTLKDPPFNCSAYPEMDRSGYEDCLDDYYRDLNDKERRKQARRCDCFDFMTIRERCQRRVYDHNCQVDFDSVAAGKYDIRVSKAGREADVEVMASGSYREIANGKCQEVDARTDEEDNYVGTGEYTAHSKGIYWCH